MIRPRSIREYVEDLKSAGAPTFSSRNRTPVLVGEGVVGEIADRNQPAGSTKFIDVGKASEAVQGANLVDRVWLIRKDPDAPPGPGITVGRNAGNDLVIPEYSISQKHCEFRYQVMRVVIVDLGSLNGTFVGQERLKPNAPRPVANGDPVVLGRFRFRFFTADGFVKHLAERAAQADGAAK